jgi:hypothetical protein
MISRRGILAGLGGLAAGVAPSLAKSQGTSSLDSASSLPAKQDFEIPASVTYLNCAHVHPMPLAAAAAARAWAEFRAHPQAESRPKEFAANVKAEFAALLNAKESEIRYYIRRLGVENILAHRQPMLKRLHQEMPRLGYEALTPPEGTSALVSFAVKDYESVERRLHKAGVNARVSQRYIRISPSVFNDMNNIEKLLEALA